MFLSATNRIAQRDIIRIKNKHKWLILEMKQPTLTVIKNFESNNNNELMSDTNDFSPRKFTDEQKVEWRLKTQILDDFAKS